jgi:putative ABC transport system substrate-binding protein
MGLVSSLSRPGGNITGASGMATDLMPKQLELLQQALPRMTHIAVLLNPTNPSGSRVMRTTAEEAASRANLAVVFIEARNTEELTGAFSRAKASKADAVVSGPDSFFIQARADIAKAGMANALPTMFMQREHVDAGGLMSYGPNMMENYRRAANFVDRILRGAKPGELPVEQPAKLDLVINLKTARAVGLTIPPALLVRADDVLR